MPKVNGVYASDARVERVRNLAAIGMRQFEIAALIGAHVRTVGLICASRGIETVHGCSKAEERETALDMIVHGASRSAAARVVGVSRQSVTKWAKEAGL